MRVTRVEPLAVLEGEACGDVEGTGRWHFSTHGEATVVCYEWRVRTKRGWMNLLAPLARPFFKWNHDYVMQRGGEALADLLDARLLGVEHSS
jgi:hypothetical protein